MALRTDYKDDILDLTQNTQRKYRMVTNNDGTVSFVDMTVYLQVGDSFGSAQLNEISNAVNEGGSNMYYEPETDIRYLKNQNGEWVKVGIGGLLWDGSLYREGNTYSDITGGWSLQKISGTSTLTFNTSDMKLQNSAGKSIVSTNNKIDFSRYTKLHIEGSIEYGGKDVPYFEVGFGTGKNTMETVVYSKPDTTTSGVVTISETVDISAHNSNPLYVQFCARPQNGNDSYNIATVTNLYFLP